MRGLLHDWSKLTPYGLYVNVYFLDEIISIKKEYGFLNTKMASYGLQLGVLKHRSKHDHHWEYWLLIHGHTEATPVQMKESATKEMLCDWISTSKIWGNDLHEWYEKTKTI